MKSTAPRAPRDFGRSAAMLGVAFGIAGTCTYGFFAITSHSLSGTEYGEIAVLWSAVFISFSIACRPIEQLLSKSIAEARAHGTSTADPIRGAALIQLALCLGFLLAALAFRDFIETELFSGRSTLFWAFICGVLGSSVAFFLRGCLAGKQMFAAYSALIILESGARLVTAGVLAAGLTSDRDVVVAGIAFAPLLTLVLLPLAVGRKSQTTMATRPRQDEKLPEPSRGAALTGALTSGGGFAAALVMVLLSEQVLLILGPLLVRAAEGTARAGYTFNVLILAVGPLLLFQAIASSLLPHLTQLHVAGHASAFRRTLRNVLTGVCAFAALMVITVAAAGPPLMHIAFGDSFDYGRAELIGVAAGMGFYLGASTLTQAALARGRAGPAAFRWGVCGAAFLAWNALVPLSQVRAVETGFLGASVLLFVLLAASSKVVPRVPQMGSRAQL